MLHTTFSLLHKADACEKGYRMLAKHLRGVRTYGKNTPIPLTVVLDSNGIDDAIWCLRATAEPASALSRDMAADWADMVRALFTDSRSAAAIDVARRHARGQATDQELFAAGAAAGEAALAAAGEAAWAAQSAHFRARLAAHDPISNPLGEILEPVVCLLQGREVTA